VAVPRPAPERHRIQKITQVETRIVVPGDTPQTMPAPPLAEAKPAPPAKVLVSVPAPPKDAATPLPAKPATRRDMPVVQVLQALPPAMVALELPPAPAVPPDMAPAQAKSEPQIRINIGQIRVTAPQPAPAAAPVVPRTDLPKGQALKAYLGWRR
jgi:hypothetical protein